MHDRIMIRAAVFVVCGLAGVVASPGCQQERAARPIGKRDEFHIHEALRFLDGDDENARGNARIWLRHFAPDDLRANLALAEALNGASVAGRREILATLSTVAPACQQAVPYIENALRDGDGIVRCRAVEALFRLKLGKEEAIALIDNELERLGLGKPEFDEIGQVKRRDDWLVQGEAASVLWRIEKTRRAASLLCDAAAAVGSEPQIILTLYRGAPDSIRFLTDRLHAEQRSERYAALAALYYLGPDAKSAEGAVVEAMSERHVGIQYVAAETLGRIGAETDDAADALDRLLVEGAPDERFAAAKSLARMQHYRPAAVDFLIERLTDATPGARRTACYALGQIGPQAAKATPMLAAAMSDADESVRQASMTAVARIGPRTIPTLIAALDSPNPRCRATALEALRYVGGDRSAALPRIRELIDDDDRHVAMTAPFLLADLNAVDGAIELLSRHIREGDDPGIRQACVWALRKADRNVDKGVSALIAALSDEDEGVSAVALDSLSELGQRALTAESAILAACRDKRPSVPEAAVIALGNIRSSTSIPTLGAFLRADKSSNIRGNAALALGHLGARARSAAIVGLADENPGVRASALRAVYDIDGRADNAVPALIDLAQRWRFDPVNGSICQIMSIMALEHIGHDARATVPALRRMIDLYDLSLSFAATKALWEITGSTDEVLGSYFNLLAIGDDEIRRAVAGGLGAMGPAAQDAKSRLVLLLEDDATAVRLAAMRALESLKSRDDAKSQP